MLGVTVTILRDYTSTASDPVYVLRFDDSSDSSKNSVFQGLTEARLASVLQSRLPVVAGRVREIVESLTESPSWISSYPVDEPTYLGIFQ